MQMGKILEINGPLVRLELPEAVIGEQVRVGAIGLIGEVIGRHGDGARVGGTTVKYHYQVV